jgi:hypothetical protein
VYIILVQEEFRNRGSTKGETAGDKEEAITFVGVAAPLVGVGVVDD